MSEKAERAEEERWLFWHDPEVLGVLLSSYIKHLEDNRAGRLIRGDCPLPRKHKG